MRKARLPDLLPPKIDYTSLISDIAEANRALGSLDGLIANLPNKELLVTPMITKEAVASSTIEGTRATIEDVYSYEAAGKNSETNRMEKDVKEILNYRNAIRTAVDLLNKRPIGENFVKKLHEILLDSVRGASKDRGNFRKVPVFIGKMGEPIEKANYVPPEAQQIPGLISNWEKYVNSENEPETLVQIAVSHYQFEAVHLFLDGNGRIGRILIPLLLYEKGILSYPALYVSEYFENNREEYYNRLRAVDENNDWHSWIGYFLRALKVQASEAKTKALSMLAEYQKAKDIISGFGSQYAIELLDIIFENPIVSFKIIKDKIGAKSPQTIYDLLERFTESGILVEVAGGKRNKKYIFDDLIKIIG